MNTRRLWQRGGVAVLLAVILFSAAGDPAASAAATADPCALTIHPLPTTFGNFLADVVAAAPGDVWAVGGEGRYGNPYSGYHAGQPLILHWGGTDWAAAPLPPILMAPTDGVLRALTAFGPHDVWAVGTLFSAGSPPSLHPLVLHWDGAAWQPVGIPDLPAGPAATGAGALVAVDGTSATDLWTLGTSILHYDGTRWQTATVPSVGSTPLTFQSLAVLDHDDAWVVAVPQAAGTAAGPPIVLRWSGRDWSVAGGLPAGFQPAAIGGVRGQTGLWAVGNGAAHWDGVRWTAVSVPGLGTGVLQSVTATLLGEAWAVGRVPDSDSVLHSAIFHWDGRRWERLADPAAVLQNPYTNLGRIGVEGPGDAWAVGSTTMVTGSGGSGSDGTILHLFRPCGLPTVPVADPQGAGVAYFPTAQHTLRGLFRTYWERHGGLAQFGYPITEEYPEKSGSDGQTYTVQYFERNRFEAHPENAGTPYAVLLGLLGRTVTAGRLPPAEEALFHPLPRPPAGRVFFPPTGHALAAEFAAYWQARGGLAVYGYPISEPFREVSHTDGKEYLVQYFERNRLEFHPELPEAFRVSLGLLGVDILRARAWLPSRSPATALGQPGALKVGRTEVGPGGPGAQAGQQHR